MNKIRLRHNKTGKAVYISHLDLMATMRRALTRAGIQLSYSQGFNPHPYMSVALPLTVGCGSFCELMDIGLLDITQGSDLVELLTAEMPAGLEISEAYESKRKFGDIAWIEIIGQLYYDDGAPEDALDRLGECFRSKSIVISKKTKRGISDIDIAPHIMDVEFSGEGVISMKAKISAQNPSLNPDNIMSALGGDHITLRPDFAVFARTELFDSEMKKFR